MPTIKIHNIETNEIIEREMTTEELAQWEVDKVNAEAIKQAEATKAAQRQALLDKLGITEEEARLLLGGN
jgi:predicted metal-dependent HD superfamily phosphohydrolase